MRKTRTMAFANLVGSLLFITIGLWALYQTTQFGTIKNTYVQPALFPQIMIVGMLVFAVVLLIQSIFKLRTMTEDDPLTAPAPSINFIRNKGVLCALVVIAMCVLFVLFLKTLGYVICSAVVSFAIMYMIGKRNWLQMVLVSVLAPLLMWFVFYKVLTVNIPMGPLKLLAELVDKI